MSVTFRSSSEDARGESSTSTPTSPAGTTAGDLLLAIQASDKDGSLSDMSAPTGWEQISSQSNTRVGYIKVWRKTATAGEPSTYGFPDSTSANCSTVVVAVHGYDTSMPLAVTPTWSHGEESRTHPAPSVVGVAGGLLLTAHIAGTLDTRSYTDIPSGMTEAQQSAISNDGQILLGVFYDELTADGDTGAKIATCSASRPYITMSLVVRAPSMLTVSAAGGIADLTLFGNPTLSLADGIQTVTSAGGIATSAAFGTAAVSTPGAPGPFPGLTLFPGPDIFPSEVPPEAQAQVVGPATIASALAFGLPIVATADGPQTVRVTGIDTGETFPIPTVDVDPIGTQSLTTVGIFTAEGFGRPTLALQIPVPSLDEWVDTYFVDAVDLRSYAWRIEVAEGLLDTPGTVGDNVEVPGRDGLLQVFGGLGQPRRTDALGRITLHLWMKGVDPSTGEIPGGSTTEQEWYARWDELVRMLHRRQVVIDHPRPDGTIRRAFAHLLPDESIAPSRVPSSPWFARFRAVFAIPAAHWTDLTPVTTGQLELPTNGHVPLDVFAAATAPCTELTVTFGAGNNPRLATGYGHVGWNGVIEAGRQLGIETGIDGAAPRTHQASGAAWTPGYERLTYSPGPRWFEIDPSEPLQAVFTHTGGGSMTVEVAGKRRYRTS